MLERLLAATLVILLLPLPAYLYFRLALRPASRSRRRWGFAFGLVPLTLVFLIGVPLFNKLTPVSMAVLSAILVLVRGFRAPELLDRPLPRRYVSACVIGSVLAPFLVSLFLA